MVNATSASVVAVTGSAGYIGFRLLRELESMQSLTKLVAIDLKPLPKPLHNIHTHRVDIKRPLSRVFQMDSIDTMVHLAFDLREGRNVREAEDIESDNLFGLKNVLRECRRARVKNFIYLSSHTVYGAYPDNPVPITEESKPRPMEGFQYSRSKDLSEKMLQEFADENPDMNVTVLRCCVVLGPGGTNHVTQAFQKPFLLKVAGYDPPMQFIHTTDLARILAIMSVEPKPGIFNLASDGTVRYSEMAKIMGRRLVSLPSPMAYRLVQLSWNLGIQKEASSVGLNFIRYPIIMATGKIKEATGYRFYYSAREAVTAYAASNLA